jgi:hypothetical protein
MPPASAERYGGAHSAKFHRWVRLRTYRNRIPAHAAVSQANVQKGKTMKHRAIHHQQAPELPIAWRDTDFAAQWNRIGDNFDDRVSDSIFDVEDEYAEVESIVHRMDPAAN